MLFNSLAFLIFLPIVFTLYWLLQRKNLNFQNTLLLVASYVFYGYWDYRFLSLIIISSIADYIIGYLLATVTSDPRRKLLLTLSILINLGILGFFKYFDFFIDSFVVMLDSFGLQANVRSLNIILPVGISFYTFQTMSYSLDIYKGKFDAVKNPVTFFAFVGFFPQLVAGPIERARNLLPQFEQRREFDAAKATDGLRQILWGFFKKVVIADNIAAHVNRIFVGYDQMDGMVLFIGVFLFAIQIYCDFSGYSDIAIGTARLFGFSLMRNFAFPYYSRNIGEFWRRWHISLSSWFRDYLYIPLGGSQRGKFRRSLNIVVTFTVSGLWHGANWTFVLWGLLHGLYYLPAMILNLPKEKGGIVAEGKLLPSVTETIRMAVTFALVLFAWVFFRADSMSAALGYIGRFITGPFYDPACWHSQYALVVLLSVFLLAVEWIQRERQHALEFHELGTVGRWAIYVTGMLAILLLGNFGEVDFIYFQF